MAAIRNDSDPLPSAAVRGGITVRRHGRLVRVACQAGPETDHSAAEALHAALLDLIDGQGNLMVEVVLPDTEVVDLRLNDVLVDAARRLKARAGRFAVTTKGGSWEPGPAR